MSLKGITEQGVTQIRTRRQNLRILGKVLLFLAGAALCLYLGAAAASVVTGHGWHLPVLRVRPLLAGKGSLINIAGKAGNTKHLQFPVLLILPVPWRTAALGAVPLLLAWIVLLRTPLLRRRRHTGPERHRGFASVKEIKELYSARAVRATGIFTLPGTTKWQQMMLPINSFGYHVGSPHNPRVKRMGLWFNFETRLRIVARAGWGKSWRLLIPIIRNLPGAAVVTSIEPEIFTTTVKARMWRKPAVRWAWARVLRKKWRTPVRFPVYVADLASPESKFASGFPAVRWNPIVGCENFRVATNRARALVTGGDGDGKSDSGTDKFFRDSATEVLAAWLQAAAMDPAKDIEDLVRWLRDTDLATARTILQTAATPEAATAVMNMVTHLDPAAGRTTSGVKRYLNFAISSLASGQGRALCGPRGGAQFDMAKLIAAGGTLYLLAEPEEMELARPILTLFATEMFRAAERVARKLPGSRLRQTFMGVFDELFAGVRLPLLPYVAAVQRKYGISYAYAIQSASDEEELFGQSGAERIRTQSTTIVGGYDVSSAQETARRAGRIGVVTRSRNIGTGSGSSGSEQIQQEDVLPESDQQKIKNGQSIITGLGLPLFMAYTDRVDHKRKIRKTIRRERREVEQFVARRRMEDLAELRADQQRAKQRGAAAATAAAPHRRPPTKTGAGANLMKGNAQNPSEVALFDIENPDRTQGAHIA